MEKNSRSAISQQLVDFAKKLKYSQVTTSTQYQLMPLVGIRTCGVILPLMFSANEIRIRR